MEIDRKDGSLRTGSQLIASELKIGCAVLNGANVANDVAHEHFAEVNKRLKEKIQKTFNLKLNLKLT